VEKKLLREEKSKPTYKFFASGDTKSFSSLARRFLGPEVGEVHSSKGDLSE
jgi:hypothetical protein